MLLVFTVSASTLTVNAQKKISTQVLIVGGGTGGTAAGIQSARMGVQTLIVEPTPWLGGMLSSAGVSAIDGNHNLPSGLWKEFRDHIYKVYGGPEKVFTGWVSNTQFEPHVADSIWKVIAAKEAKLAIRYGYEFERATKKGNRITGAIFKNAKGETLTVTANIVMDATELGDVMKSAGVPYDKGMEAGSITGEKVGIEQSNGIIQDLTYTAVLKDFGKGVDKTIPCPADYDPLEFDCATTQFCHDTTLEKPRVDNQSMLNYAKLPNEKYLLNWPLHGNDIYLDVIEMSHAERAVALEKAKAVTLRFVYFIQHELGYKNLGLAEDEFPTKDLLPLIPYHREGRRMQGAVRFTMRHIDAPYTYGTPLYRTGISVGDYPIDHHHKKNAEAPQHLEFYPVPSFNVPLGVMIPKQAKNFIVAEKGISVSNIVNGTTRLQPCVMLTGQAAGVLAALSVQQNTTPAQISVRAVQGALLQSKAYIMPYYDVKPYNDHFLAIQEIGATGILKGKGVPFKWANQTWFYPDSTVTEKDFALGLMEFNSSFNANNFNANTALTKARAYEMINTFVKNYTWNKQIPTIPTFINKEKDSQQTIKRKELANWLKQWVDPFKLQQIDINGNWMHQ
ncbi:FAD dependent oxidoreductase [Chitinophaga skermanii]|uniref:FAD dependent oxidoreductase n=1 Tax=Chitinophaga skermanii TaxID=331697 RepID=A0A327R2N1_9BACT|nr:FAD-dependent oxidoreductase [Chitinophaga skermanii]RAJ10940.1 FAD dependent oxidoreductase [Chitinophaga skermanii]